MKFTVPVQAVLAPISQVSGICNSQGVNPDDLTPYMLMEVKENLLTLIGTDNNVQLTARIPLPDGACISEGACLLGASKARDFFKTLGGDDDISLELDEEEENLRLVSADGNYTMRIRKPESDHPFPVFNPDETEEGEEKAPVTVISIEENKLRYMIEKSIFCVSHDNYRDYLRGVRFEARDDDFAVFALDGHRMAVLETKLSEPCSNPVSVSLTLRGATELNKLLSNLPDRKIALQFNGNFAVAEVGVFTLSSRLLKCNYPNVRAVLPKELNPEIAVNLETLKTYVKRVASFSNKRLNSINLAFSGDRLRLFAQNVEREVGSAELPVDYLSGSPDNNDRPTDVNLNVDFVKDFLNAIDSPRVVFGFAPPYSNTQMRPDVEFNEQGIRVRYVVSHIIV